MLRSILIASLSLAACKPAGTTQVYPSSAPAAETRTVAMRGKVPRGTRVEYVIAVQIDQRGKRRRIRVRPAADGSYALHLPPGHRYAMAYETQGRIVGNVSFPNAHGKPSQTINLSQNVVVNQQFIELGEPTYAGGAFVAAADPLMYMDSDGDGTVDAQDLDDDGDGTADAQDPDDSDVVADSSMFAGDFEDAVDDAAVPEAENAVAPQADPSDDDDD